jgi:hypothetical protein
MSVSKKQMMDVRNDRRRQIHQEAVVRERFEAALHANRAQFEVQGFREAQRRAGVEARRDLAAHDRESAAAHAAMLEAAEASRRQAMRSSKSPIAPVVITKHSVLRDDIEVMNRQYVKMDVKVVRHLPNANVADRYTVVNQVEEAVQRNIADLRKAVLKEMQSRWREEERVATAIHLASERKREDWFTTSTKALDLIDRSGPRNNRLRSAQDVLRLAHLKQIEVADERDLQSNFDDMVIKNAQAAPTRRSKSRVRSASSSTTTHTTTTATTATVSIHDTPTSPSDRHSKESVIRSKSMGNQFESPTSVMDTENEFDGFKCQRIDRLIPQPMPRWMAPGNDGMSSGRNALQYQLDFAKELEDGGERAEQARLAEQAASLPVFTSASNEVDINDSASVLVKDYTYESPYGSLRPWREYKQEKPRLPKKQEQEDTISIFHKSGGRVLRFLPEPATSQSDTVAPGFVHEWHSFVDADAAPRATTTAFFDTADDSVSTYSGDGDVMSSNKDDCAGDMIMGDGDVFTHTRPNITNSAGVTMDYMSSDGNMNERNPLDVGDYSVSSSAHEGLHANIAFDERYYDATLLPDPSNMHHSARSDAYPALPSQQRTHPLQYTATTTATSMHSIAERRGTEIVTHSELTPRSPVAFDDSISSYPTTSVRSQSSYSSYGSHGSSDHKSKSSTATDAGASDSAAVNDSAGSADSMDRSGSSRSSSSSSSKGGSSRDSGLSAKSEDDSLR